MSAARGLTLLEVQVAGAITLVVILGIVAISVARLRMHEELREITVSDQSIAALASLNIAKTLEGADRINIVRTGFPPPGPPWRGHIQIRVVQMTTDGPGCVGCTGAVPPACCFDIAANYRWDQYRRDPATDELLLFRNTAADCTDRATVAGQITRLTFEYIDESASPGTSDPFGGPDNNVIQYRITWNDGQGKSQEFGGKVTLRNLAYTNINASGRDSGWGLTATDVSPPPGNC